MPKRAIIRAAREYVRFIGHGPADQLGPVCAPTTSLLAAEALQRVADVAEFDLILAELLPSRCGWEAALGGTATRGGVKSNDLICARMGTPISPRGARTSASSEAA